MAPARWRLALAAVLGMGLASTPARGFEDFTLGAGVLGVVGGDFIDKPDDQTIPIDGQDVQPAGIPEYPGFAGLTAGFGFFFEGRVFGYAGLELDVLRTTDSGDADLKIAINNVENNFTVEISHAAWHLPLLVKGVLPGEIVSPSVFLGPEFVLPDSDAELTTTAGAPPVTPTFGAYSDSYTMFTFGIGLEFNLVFIPDVDIRIPFSLRGSYDPGVSDKRSERAVHTVTGSTVEKVEFKTEWKYQAIATIGAAVHF